MKQIFILVLMLVLLGCTAIAESTPTREFTIDEQAYDVYLDISYVMDNTVEYLEELRRLWDIALHAESVEDANNLELIECISEDYLVSITHMYLTKYGYSDSEYEQRMFSGPDIKFKEKTDLIWYYLALGIEARYLVSMDSLKPYLDDAMSGIRSIMATDREYPFLKDLQNYYKETVLIHGYASDFNDNYTGFDSKLDSYKTSRDSWSIDFEFIFNPEEFKYVREVRTTESEEKKKEIHTLAASLENSGDYVGAINLYWQCRDYSDSLERLIACQNSIKEEKYQVAVEYENSEVYPTAVILYEELGNYKDSSARKLHCGNYIGYETISGRYVTEALGGFSNGVAALKKNGKWGYINTDGDVVIPFEYDSALTFSEGLAAVEKNGKWGYIDINNNAIIPLEYIYATSMVDGSGVVWKVRDNNNNVSDAGYVSKKGIYTKADRIPQSYGRVISDGLRTSRGNSYGSAWGYENQNGEVVIACQFGYAYDFSDGMGCVCNGDTYIDTTRYGFVNTEGELVIPYLYESALDFHEGYAPVMKNGQWGLINKVGEVVLPLEHSAVTVCREGYFITLDEGIIHIHSIDEL